MCFQCKEINDASCKIAREVAEEGDALVLGGVCQTPTYLSGQGKEAVKAEFRKQVQVFVEKKVDFLLAEVQFLILFSFFFFSDHESDCFIFIISEN